MLRDSNSRPDITRSIAIHDNYCARFQKPGILHGGQEIPEFVPWNYSFKDAYRLLQQRTMAVSGQYGPINIYAPDMRALFLLFVASRKPSFKWKDAEAFDKNAAPHCALSIKEAAERSSTPSCSTCPRHMVASPRLVDICFRACPRAASELHTCDAKMHTQCCCSPLQRERSACRMDQIPLPASPRTCTFMFSGKWSHAQTAQRNSTSCAAIGFLEHDACRAQLACRRARDLRPRA